MLEYKKEISLVLLRDTLRIRMIESRLAELYAEYEMRCPTHFSLGQEAVAVGVCHHLKKQELITSAHRSHAHYLAKGGSLKKMVAVQFLLGLVLHLVLIYKEKINYPLSFLEMPQQKQVLFMKA